MKPILLTALSLALGFTIVAITIKAVKKRKQKADEWEPSNNKEDQTDNIFFT